MIGYHALRYTICTQSLLDDSQDSQEVAEDPVGSMCTVVRDQTT